MSACLPQYTLRSHADSRSQHPRWSFELCAASDQSAVQVEEIETEATGERLELLAVLRGLEALSQPSRVIIMTASDYVRRGIRHGLEEWRANNWHWERYGELVPIKNLDLWRRIDRALAYHTIEFKTFRVDPAESIQPHTNFSPVLTKSESLFSASANSPPRTLGRIEACMPPQVKPLQVARAEDFAHETFAFTERTKFCTRSNRDRQFYLRRVCRRGLALYLRFRKRSCELLESLIWFAGSVASALYRTFSSEIPRLEIPSVEHNKPDSPHSVNPITKQRAERSA
jgi:ribonuclease HI